MTERADPATEREGTGADGFVLVDKPAGVTSHTVVGRAKREYDAKAGHAGTLDPFATGLLVVLLGRATRLQRYVLGLPKTYEATARLGWISSTGDRDGELTETGSVPERLELPTGRIEQMVPLTSAVKVDGERLYKRAHRGEEMTERPVREVEIYSAELLEHDPASARARFEIRCSAGTYIRTLVEELGDAYCEELRRTAVGELRIENAGDRIHPPAGLVEHLPAIEIDDAVAEDALNGRPLPEELPVDGPFRLLCGGRLIAVAGERDGRLKTEVVFS